MSLLCRFMSVSVRSGVSAHEDTGHPIGLHWVTIIFLNVFFKLWFRNMYDLYLERKEKLIRIRDFRTARNSGAPFLFVPSLSSSFFFLFKIAL